MPESLFKKITNAFTFLPSFFSSDLAVDLGTANIRIYVLGKGIQINEPSCVARNKKTKKIVALGHEAKEMLGKTPSTLEAFRPLKNGVIADFDATEALLRFYFEKIKKPAKKSASKAILAKIARPKVMMAIPSGVTEVERMAFQEVALEAGARQAYLIEQALAAAIGAGLPVLASKGTMIVDIGGGTTEVALVSLGGIVVSRSIRSAGDEMDEAVKSFCRLKYSLLLGIQSAEKVKVSIGSALPYHKGKEKHTVVRGRDLETGLPRSVRLSADEIREAMAPITNNLVQTIKEAVEETPPELIGDVMERGITLAGGGALLSGLAEKITQETKIPAVLAEKPQTAVVQGAAKVLEDKLLFEKAVVR